MIYFTFFTPLCIKYNLWFFRMSKASASMYPPVCIGPRKIENKYADSKIENIITMQATMRSVSFLIGTSPYLKVEVSECLLKNLETYTKFWKVY